MLTCIADTCKFRIITICISPVSIWIHVIWIRVLCKRGYICLCTHTRIPSAVVLFGRQIVLLVFFNISDNATSVRYGIHVHTVTYHRSFNFDTHSQLYQTNSDLLVSVKMRNIRYGLLFIILLVLAELCAGQLCITNYCCQYCNYY